MVKLKRAASILLVVLTLGWIIGSASNEQPQVGPTLGQEQAERARNEELAGAYEEEQRQAGYAAAGIH
jgi:hypothetical protein